jgi:hypothetical protein
LRWRVQPDTRNLTLDDAARVRRSLSGLAGRLNEGRPAGERDVLAIVATHDPLMMELADHLVELRDGEVVSEERRAAAFSGEGAGLAAAAGQSAAG